MSPVDLVEFGLVFLNHQVADAELSHGSLETMVIGRVFYSLSRLVESVGLFPYDIAGEGIVQKSKISST